MTPDLGAGDGAGGAGRIESHQRTWRNDSGWRRDVNSVLEELTVIFILRVFFFAYDVVGGLLAPRGALMMQPHQCQFQEGFHAR